MARIRLTTTRTVPGATGAAVTGALVGQQQAVAARRLAATSSRDAGAIAAGIVDRDAVAIAEPQRRRASRPAAALRRGARPSPRGRRGRAHSRCARRPAGGPIRARGSRVPMQPPSSSAGASAARRSERLGIDGCPPSRISCEKPGARRGALLARLGVGAVVGGWRRRARARARHAATPRRSPAPAPAGRAIVGTGPARAGLCRCPARPAARGRDRSARL